LGRSAWIWASKVRWCARWAWLTFLLVGACQPPPLAAAQQMTLIVHYARGGTVDTVHLTPPAQLELWLGRDSVQAHLVCGLVYRVPPTSAGFAYSFALRWRGDTLQTVQGTWRPFCTP